MANQQIAPPLLFPGECWRHKFNRDITQEDWEEFNKEEMNIWQSKIIKLFERDPKVQPGDVDKQRSTAIIGSDVDFLALNLWPKMEKADLLKLLSVCK